MIRSFVQRGSSINNENSAVKSRRNFVTFKYWNISWSAFSWSRISAAQYHVNLFNYDSSRIPFVSFSSITKALLQPNPLNYLKIFHFLVIETHPLDKALQVNIIYVFLCRISFLLLFVIVLFRIYFCGLVA